MVVCSIGCVSNRRNTCVDYCRKVVDISEKMGDIHNAQGAVAIEAAVRMLNFPGNFLRGINND